MNIKYEDIKVGSLIRATGAVSPDASLAIVSEVNKYNNQPQLEGWVKVIHNGSWVATSLSICNIEEVVS